MRAVTKGAKYWRGGANLPDFLRGTRRLGTRDSWRAFPVANRMQIMTAKVTVLEQLEVHTGTSVPQSETGRTRMGTGLGVSKHACRDHASSCRNSCRRPIHGGTFGPGEERPALHFVPNLGQLDGLGEGLRMR